MDKEEATVVHSDEITREAVDTPKEEITTESEGQTVDLSVVDNLKSTHLKEIVYLKVFRYLYSHMG